MLNFLKNWTLPIAMLAGALGYFIFANFTFLEPTKPFVNTLVSYLTPFLIFGQLLLTFCKVDWRELMPSPWHGWLLLFQIVSSCVLASLLIFVPMGGSYREVFEAAMVCLICPTATAAAVITGKLGGKRIQFDYLYLVIEYSGSGSRTIDISFGRTSCGCHFLCCLSEDIE